MPEGNPGDVTVLLRAWRQGDEDAFRKASSLLYTELRRQASRYMRREPAGHVLQTTALVHEAFLRLPGTHAVDWRDRGHFLAVAARVMRRVLVDVARENQSQKRGEGAVHVPLDEQLNAPGPSLPDLVALDEALDQLGRIDPRKVQVIELRFFGGLTVDETAKVLEVSPDTVARDWRMARTWLLRRLSDPRD